MTNKEIVKALECCIKNECTNCPINKMFCSDKVAIRHALELINRQQAQIERLHTEKDNLIKTFAECQKDVIKEFAGRAKEKMRDLARVDFQGDAYCLISESFFDNLVKEIVGDTE